MKHRGEKTESNLNMLCPALQFTNNSWAGIGSHVCMWERIRLNWVWLADVCQGTCIGITVIKNIGSVWLERGCLKMSDYQICRPDL